MNVFEIYDSSCTGRSYDSMTARSQEERKEANMGENEDFLRLSESVNKNLGVKASIGWLKSGVSASEKYNAKRQKIAKLKQKRAAARSSTDKLHKKSQMVFDYSSYFTI